MTDFAVKYDSRGYLAARDQASAGWREKLDQACEGWQAQLERRAVREAAQRLQQARPAPKPTRINRDLILRPTPTGIQPVAK